MSAVRQVRGPVWARLLASLVRGTTFALALCAGTANAQDVKIVATAPDVELRSAETGRWKPAEDGDILHPGDVVSTGYDSQVVLGFGGAAFSLLNPMTQVRLEEQGSDHGKRITRLYLRIGGLRAKVTRRGADRRQFTISTNTGTTEIGPVETFVGYDEEFGTKVQTLKGRSHARARHGAKLPVPQRQTAKLSERQAKTPREVYRDRVAPDLTPWGADDAERDATRDLDRAAVRPTSDHTTPNSLQDLGRLNSGDSALVFRFEVQPGQ